LSEPPQRPGPDPEPYSGPSRGDAPPARSGSGTDQVSTARLRAELDADIRRIEGENSEIDMLMEQVLVEIERHQARRAKLESELEGLEQVVTPDMAQIRETRSNLLALTRRELLFDAQRQVLEGKQRVLARFLQRIVEIDNSLAAMAGTSGRPTPAASVGLRPLALAAGARMAQADDQPAQALRSQEELRRDIVRQLHDGPAQSIANIGLQAEIVERLMAKGDPRARDEIGSLRRLVQQALDATKEFIFEIRPMVLDDLGLGPTIRRTASDRGRRSGISVDFASQGSEARLDPDVESAVFRCVDEAIAGYLALRPPSVIVRLDWSERELLVTVAGTWPIVREDGVAAASSALDTRASETPPVLLAMMEEARSQDREARTAARSLPVERIAEITMRARALGLRLTTRDEGQTLELLVPRLRRP
jgi:two-component system, NarL family, sensor histidine kinase DegS